MEISLAKKKKGIFCCAYSCTNKPDSKKGGLCAKHYARKIKQQDIVQYRYNYFKSNAIKRNKEFTITLEEFRRFCQRTGYMIKKGVRGRAATIDRRCNVQGYHIWNIQLLTMSQNLKKYIEHDRYQSDVPF
ncbi:MAG: hypothetical protein ACK4IZ_03350 [Flavobacterium sp.]|uniref:hypothetical protein n=1 Tax=Flavobacterium sp. TaxID=239 RepID=UPI00391CAB46